MPTNLQTSLPIPVLVIGALVSIVLFLVLFRREMAGVPAHVRWMITVLRVALCLLVWGLIAQPRAITVRETNVPVSTRLAVDVSGSMSLKDASGLHTSRWLDQTDGDPLEEATAFTEAAKIRLQLLKRDFGIKRDKRVKSIEKTRETITQAQLRLGKLDTTASQKRLVGVSVKALEKSLEQLDQLEDGDAIRTLERAVTFVTEAATGLRRVSEANPVSVDIQAPLARIEWVNRWLSSASELIERLKGSGEFQLIAFANGMSPAEEEKELSSDKSLGEGTDLYENVNKLVERENQIGKNLFVLVTDGMDSDPDRDWDASTKLLNQPLLVLPVGDPSTLPDIRIESVISPTRVRENDAFLAQVEIGIQNAMSQPITVSLLDGSQVLARRDVQLDGSSSTKTVELEWSARGLGPREFRVEASSAPNEELVGNNVKQLTCQVIKDKYNVLVCDSKPRWETRYLQNLFKRDTSIEMVSLLFEPRHAYPGNEPSPPQALPLVLELWQKFDLVILGDVGPKHLTPDHQKLLVEYVHGGGNLLLLAGYDFMPAAYTNTPMNALVPMLQTQAEPVQGTFVIVPDEQTPDPMVRLARENGQSVWRGLFTMTPQFRISAWSKAKQTARRLLVAEDQQSGEKYDFMALQRYGRGHVAFAAAPCLYHLRTIFGDQYHARFWGQMIRGICVDNYGFEGGLIKTRLDRTVWQAGDEVRGSVRLTTQSGLPVAAAKFAAKLMDGDQTIARMQPIPDPDRPGDYFVRFPDAKPGAFIIHYEGEEIESLMQIDQLNESNGSQNQLDGVAAARKLTVVENGLSPETTHRSKRSPFWDKVNQMPMAATVTPQTLALVVDALDFQPEQRRETSTHALWDAWWFLLAMILVACIEWLLRRTNGLC